MKLAHSAMIHKKRLQLIAVAVRYSQQAKKDGIPAVAYTKAPREPVHFLWERRFCVPRGRVSGPKVCAAKFVSKAARPPGTGNLAYDHAIPFKLIQEKLLDLSEVSIGKVRRLLNRLCVPALITKKENQLLNRAGYRKRIPEGWHGVDRLARYKAVGIRVLKHRRARDKAAAGRGGHLSQALARC